MSFSLPKLATFQPSSNTAKAPLPLPSQPPTLPSTTPSSVTLKVLSRPIKSPSCMRRQGFRGVQNAKVLRQFEELSRRVISSSDNGIQETPLASKPSEPQQTKRLTEEELQTILSKMLEIDAEKLFFDHIQFNPEARFCNWHKHIQELRDIRDGKPDTLTPTTASTRKSSNPSFKSPISPARNLSFSNLDRRNGIDFSSSQDVETLLRFKKLRETPLSTQDGDELSLPIPKPACLPVVVPQSVPSLFDVKMEEIDFSTLFIPQQTKLKLPSLQRNGTQIFGSKQ